MAHQTEIQLPKFNRGIHLITHLIESELKKMQIGENGILHLFVKHTSAGITLNENADPSVRTDLNTFLNTIAPENQHIYTHTDEGADDMPAHIKTALIGNSVTLPITCGKLNLGTWQGIYFCEFRNHAQARRLILTLIT